MPRLSPGRAAAPAAAPAAAHPPDELCVGGGALGAALERAHSTGRRECINDLQMKYIPNTQHAFACL